MTYPLPQKTDVLIVGAGPTGLTAALSLHKAGCKDITIVDSVVGGDNTSRAAVVHSATLEALDEIGCADTIVASGVRALSMKTWDGYSIHRIVDFSVLNPHTKFPFVLIVPQHVTERVLLDHLEKKGINVVRPVKVTTLTPNEADPETTDVTFEDGRVVQARYIVGADGSRSIVRKSAGIGFRDPDGEDALASDVTQAVLADITLKNPPPETGPADLLGSLRHGNFSICIPLPPAEYGGEQAWRIALGVPSGTPPHTPPIEYLQDLLEAYGPPPLGESTEPLKITKVFWSSRFRTLSAIADTPFTRLKTREGTLGGAILLAGDAAHIHSPIGGQGMNLGIRDAVFLGPVLAQHAENSSRSSVNVDRTALDKPLENWAKARHERALKTITMTKRGLNVMTWKDEISWYYGAIPINWALVRNWTLRALVATGILRRVTPWRLSGLDNR